MLYSFQQAAEQASLAEHTKQFVRAALQVPTPQGFVLGPQALSSYVDNLVGVEELVGSVTDTSSVARVDQELRRRFLTGRVPEDVTQALVEALEVLGLDKNLQVTDKPLIAFLSTDEPLAKPAVIINVIGKKSLADAIRTLYARLYTHPYPEATPNASIILARMPSAQSTAHVSLDEERAVVHAVHGWGLLVGTKEVSDVYELRLNGSLQDKQVRVQDSMVYRNPRSGEVVQTRPRDASGQKITDDEARTLVLLTKKAGVSEAVFGLSHEQSWLLATPQAAQAKQPEVEPTPQLVQEEQEVSVVEEEPARVEEEDASLEPTLQEEVSTPQISTQQESDSRPEIVIVDLEEEDSAQEATPQQAATQQEASKQEVTPQPLEESQTRQEPSTEPVTSQTSAQQAAPQDAQECYDATKRTAQQLLTQALASIELTLREWLAEDAPSEFEEVVKRVSARRQVPYKNRVLTLHEMSVQGAFSDPSPEAVRFALETLERFRREF